MSVKFNVKGIHKRNELAAIIRRKRVIRTKLKMSPLSTMKFNRGLDASFLKKHKGSETAQHFRAYARIDRARNRQKFAPVKEARRKLAARKRARKHGIHRVK